MPEEQSIKINAAALKDDFCHYSYEITSGPTEGDELKRKGSLIVHNDLREAFKKLKPHLAVICEEINASDINDIEDIAEFDDTIHQLGGIEHKVSHFHVGSFSITGTGENESVVLAGTKMLSTGDYVELKSPKTEWEGQYHFINELRVAIDDATTEVERYMNGKSRPKVIQAEIGFKEPEETEENR